MQISIDGRWFKDEHGRTLHLRGVNLGGSTKVPHTPNGATWNRESFFDHRNVSFVGKPFPLEEADEHFSRLKKWGLTFLRFLVTWEAIEHAGPGLYDEEYLDYVYAVVKKAAEYDIYLFIDPHQDVWSRFSGGDGAPGWTFEAAGMDITRFKQTGAAFTHQEHGDPYPRMIWTSNYGKFACATMFTLFFGGNDYAPETKVDNIPIQEYLQSHYINAVKQVALRLKDLPNVVGYDTMNEPTQGYIAFEDLNAIPFPIVAQGPSPTGFQGILLAAGFPQEVVIKSQLPFRLGKPKTTSLNAGGASLWLQGHEPLWKKHGVWDIDTGGKPQLLRPDYFKTANGQEVNFGRHHFTPFVKRFIREIRSVHPEAAIFISPPPGVFQHGESSYALAEEKNIVFSPHWYDGLTLNFQRYIPWLGVDIDERKLKFSFGRQRVRKNFSSQIKRLINETQEYFGRIPTVIGETGIAMNMHKKDAYRTGDFSKHVNAMDDTIQALEANLVNFTLWNYTADNTNDRGDLWNDEDLSIFSRDQGTGSDDIHAGGRALQAVVRPYALKTPGEPLRMSYDVKTLTFEFEFRLDPDVDMPAELFVPDYAYPDGYTVKAPCGKYETNPESQTLIYFPNPDISVHRIKITT